MRLAGATVVVTGASSGIGKAAALALGDRGANVVVAARREQPLREVAQSIRGHAVPTDVSDPAAVERLAQAAVDRYGRIDAWVNNAGVYLVAEFESTPQEAIERLYAVNVFGVMHGCRAVLPHFRRRGAGVIVNVASVDAYLGTRYSTAYASSKWAVRGFTDALRQDLRDTEIAVCLVSPAAIDTPLFDHSANYSGRRLKPPHPTYDAESVAGAIVEAIEDRKRERIVGGGGKVFAGQRKVAPRLVDAMFAEQLARDHFLDEPAAPTDGNLYEPLPDGTGVSGGWRNGSSTLRRVAGVAALAGVGLVAARAADERASRR